MPRESQARKDFNLRQMRHCHENRIFMNEWKIDKGCEAVDIDGNACGYNAHPSALQFDHIDPTTKYRTKNGNVMHPSQMVRLKRSVLIAELEKCRVLCANCHMVYTHTIQREVSKARQAMYEETKDFSFLRRVGVENVSG